MNNALSAECRLTVGTNRCQQMFDIIVNFPASLPALADMQVSRNHAVVRRRQLKVSPQHLPLTGL
jgi:hypothetical protein